MASFNPADYGATPVSSGSFDPSQFGATPVPTTPTPAAKPDSFASMAANVGSGVSNAIQSIFPGKAIGTALGHSVQSLGDLATGNYQGFLDQGNDPSMDPLKVGGDAASAVLTAGAPELGSAGGALARIGTNAAIGAGLGASNSVAQGDTLGQTAENTATSGVLGGGISAAGEGISSLLSKMPARLVQNILPKLDPKNVDYALQNTSLGSLKSMLSDSQSNVERLSQQIGGTLSHPDLPETTGAGANAVYQTLDRFPSSDYTPASVVSTLKSVLPSGSKLIDKVANGTATIAEKNDLRMALDPNFSKVFKASPFDTPQISASKQVALEFTNALRNEVQGAVPQTQPMFSELSKEINLRNALNTASTKADKASAISLKDILSYGTLGLSGLIGEKAITTPSVALATAKGLNGVANSGAVNPLSNLLARVGIRGLTGGTGTPTQ